MEAIATKTKKRFCCFKKEGKRIMQILGMAINANTVLPILESVRISLSKDGVVMFVTDLENTIRIEVDTSFYEGEIDVCVSYNCLRWIFNKAISDKVTLDFKDGVCIMQCDDVKVTVLSETSDNFPKFPSELDGMEYLNTVDGKYICNLLRPALNFVSSNDLRPSITGINVRNHNNYLTIASTDAHRLYWRHIHEFKERIDAVMPKKFAKIFCECFPKSQVELMVCTHFFAAKSEKIKILSRRIGARYPEWPTVIPKFNYSFSFDRAEMLRKLDAVKFFADHSTWQIKVSVTKDRIKVDAGDRDFSTSGEFQVAVKSSEGFSATEDIVFGLNLVFFMEHLLVNPNEQLAKIEHTGLATRAIKIDDCAILMPLLINEI